MKSKKASLIFSIVIIGLLLLIGATLSNILDSEAKEVKVARKFIEELYNNGIIEKNNIIEEDVVKEDVLNKVLNKNYKIKYSVIIGNYGVDINKDYDVLGFSNKNLGEKKYKADELTEDEVISIAKDYVSKISNEEFSFKEIKLKEDTESLVYNVIFYKYKNGYPCYNQEISTLINKITGNLEGYTNYPLDFKKYIDEVKIDKNTAIKNLKDNFKKLDINATIEDNTILAYINNTDEEMVLAYIFDIKVINKENKEEILKAFVRVDTGEVINYNLESMAIK